MTLPISTAQEHVAAIMEHFGIPGAGLAIVSGEDSAAWGYGVCTKGQNEAVTPDTTFQIASCSKAYTATAAAILVDRGELNWDDPVHKHLPEFQMHDEELSRIATLRDLLSMRLGYRNEGLVNWGRNTELGVDFIFQRLRYMDVIAGFREKFTYLNPAYTLIAETVARRAGKDFLDFQNDVLHKPLGQSHTFIREGKYLPKGSHAFPHVTLDNGIEPLGEARCGGRIGESCVYSSAGDAVKWMRLHLANGVVDGKRLVSEAAMAEMHRPQIFGTPEPELGNRVLAYGMGWQFRDTPNGTILIHEGGEFGISTVTLLDPMRKLGACVYANAVSGAAIRANVYTMLDLLAGREIKDWISLFEKLTARDVETMRSHIDREFVHESSEVLPESDLAGTYFHPANGIAMIQQRNGTLEVCLADGWLYDSELERVSGNLYKSRSRYRGVRAMTRQMSASVLFLRDKQGIALRVPGLGTMRKLSVPNMHER